MSLKVLIQQDIKTALKSGDKETLKALRQFTAAIKQFEIDKREEADDAKIVEIFTKLASQRKDSIEQFQAANRQDLVSIEQNELALLQKYLPKPLSDEEVSNIIQQTITEMGANSMKDMAQVMAKIKGQIVGRADMGQVSKAVKERLSS